MRPCAGLTYDGDAVTCYVPSAADLRDPAGDLLGPSPCAAGCALDDPAVPVKRCL